MKKIVCLVLILSCLLFVGCKGDSESKAVNMLQKTDESQQESIVQELAENESNTQEEIINEIIVQDDTYDQPSEVQETVTESVLDEDNQEFVFTKEQENIDIKINERMFIAHIGDIYKNADDYMGDTIQIEGMYTYFDYGEDGICHFVYRKGPGCCGDDGFYSIEFTFDDVNFVEDDWIEVIGVLDKYMYMQGGIEYIVLRALSVEKKKERGIEFVTQ
jgi:uncharacterized membrane protein YcgQ (UPF0703/DUF1980 family)